MTTLRWLHFTDLHLGMPDRGYLPAVRDVLQKDLKKLTDALGPWDVVLFTGDLAFQGSKANYDELDTELGELWPLLTRDGHAPLLLVVPGNHDLQRNDAMTLMAQGLQTNFKIREELWSGRARMVLDTIEKSFIDYTTWWKKCPYRPKEPTQIQSGLLPGDWSFVLTKEQVRFGFLGLNTAWLDVSDDVKGDLQVDVRQLMPACGGDLPRWLGTQCDVAMLLSHHPPSWLHRDAHKHLKETILGPDRILAHLCGHLHEAAYDSRSQGGDQVRRTWQASALFGMEKLANGTTDRRHGYTAGEIRIENGRPQVRTWPRLAFRMQSDRWQVTSDPSFLLENDLANTPVETIPLFVAKAAPTSPQPPLSPAPDRPWAEAIAGSMLWLRIGADEDTSNLAREVTSACWDIWKRGYADAFPGDPWLDATYPVRVLDCLDLFLGRHVGLEPSEALALTTAPFVYQALVAAASASMLAARPESLEDTTSSKEPRNTLEQVHRKYPALVRRAGLLRDQDRTSVLTWFVHRAIALVPVLWSPEPELPLACDLKARLDTLLRSRNDIDWARLVDLARFVTVDPGTLEQRPAVAVEMPLAEILHLAARVALDPRDVSDTAVAQLGLDEEFHIKGLIAAFGKARWTLRDDGLVFAYECEHPVFDYVLRELTEGAAARLQRFHDTWGADTNYRDLLAKIPRRLSSADLQPALDRDGKRRYQLPHVRFILEHDRIRELLMGERLYQDPTLAIREMYQNALDACRYRRARQEYLNRRGEGQWRMHAPYHGHIKIRQDHDTQGRAYIECRDNGVGMTEREIAQLFAVAGRRFVDSSEFVEERAAWRRVTPPIELHPNSQFGIGVLSYFLIADELSIRTRRFGRTGKLADNCLEVRITSVGGLFQMRALDAAELPDGGTCIRLYLRHETLSPRDEGAEPQRISCYELLKEKLWFAEFETHVHDVARGNLHWPAGQLTPGGQEAIELGIGATAHPDLWWCHRMEYEGTFLLLADGILTHSPDWGEDDGRREPEPTLCIVNLHGKRFPKLSLDRTQIMSWDRESFEPIIRGQVEALLAWPGLSMPFIWAAARYLDGHFVQQVAQRLIQRSTVLDLAPLPLLAEPGTRTKSAARVNVAALGVFSGDGTLLSQRSLRQGPELVPSQEALLRDVYSAVTELDLGGLPSLRAWRQEALERCVEPSGILDSDSTYPVELATAEDSTLLSPQRVARLSIVRPEPMDSGILGASKPVPLMSLVKLAHHYHHTLPELLQRLRTFEPLGIRLDPRCRAPESLDVTSLTSDDFRMLTWPKQYGIQAWVQGHVSPVHVLYKARELGLAPSDIASRMQALASYLGLTLDFNPAHLDGLRLDALDWKILSIDLDGQAPWLYGSIPAVHLKYAAQRLQCSASQVFDRLQPLAEPLQLDINLPCDLGTLDSLALTDQDYRILSHGERYSYGWPWITGSYPVSRIMGMMASHQPVLKPGRIQDGRELVQAVHNRLEDLAVLGIERPKANPVNLSEMIDAWKTLIANPTQATGALQELAREVEKSQLGLVFQGSLEPVIFLVTGASAALGRSLMRVSSLIKTPFVELLDALLPLRVVPMDLDAALRQVRFDEELPSSIDAELAGCIQRAMFCGAEHLDSELMAEARGHLCWLSDEEIQVHVANFAPLVEYARRYADAVARVSSYAGREP